MSYGKLQNYDSLEENFIKSFESKTNVSWNLLVRNAKDGGANSVLASYALQKSKKILQQGDETVNEMLKSVASIEEKLVDLEKFSSRIHTLSEQAKFLSLNAFIEASRAGIYGKTFSVVADELGSLTKEVKDLTVKIDQLLKQVNESASNNKKQCLSVANVFELINGELSDFSNLVKKIEDLSVHQSHTLESFKNSK